MTRTGLDRPQRRAPSEATLPNRQTARVTNAGVIRSEDFARWHGPDLFGRDHELALISAFLNRSGRDGAALLLLGDPGVGKTAMLDMAVADARRAGTQVVRAGGVEFEAATRHAGLHQTLQPLRREFGTLPSAQRKALDVALGFAEGDAPSPLLVSNATLSLLRRVAMARPVLIVVDDIHWLDRTSAAALGFVARRVSGSRIGFLAATRPGEDRFFNRLCLPEFELGPLGDEAAKRLIAVRFPTLPLGARDRVLRVSAGNPLAVLELATAVGSLPELPVVLPLGRRLEGVFAARLRDLPKATLRLLLLTALDGSGDLRVLHTSCSEPDQLKALAPAEQARLVSIDERSHRLVFRHPLIRSAVVGLATCDDRLQAHRDLAEILLSDPDRRAWHLAEATTAEHDEEIALLLEQSAQRSMRRGDAVGAVAALKRASGLSPLAADRSRRLADAAYIGARIGGDIHNAPQLLTDARRADPDMGLSLREALATAYVLLHSDGDVEGAHNVLVRAIANRRDPYPPDDSILIEALHTLLHVCLWASRPEFWPSLDHALERLSGCATLLRLEIDTRADPVHTLTPEVLRQLEDEIDSLPTEVDIVRVDRIVGVGTDVDRTPSCRASLWSIIDNGRAGGAVTTAISGLMHLSITDFSVGLWDEAQRLAEEGLELCEERGYQLLAWPFRRTIALLAAARGDTTTAVALSNEMKSWAESRHVGLVALYAHHVRELAALGRGDYEQAYHDACAISRPGELVSHVAAALWVPMDLVEAAVRTGRGAEAAAHADALRRAGVDRISPRLALLTTACEAFAAADNDASALFEQALSVRGCERWPFDRARVRLAYGEHLRRSCSMASRAQFSAALDAFTALGAEPWAQKAAGELRATGISWVRAPQPDRDALSPQELEIAMLAATGLTNKQISQRLFLSHRTVGAHLCRIYPKLGIASRAALRDALTARPNHGQASPQ